MNNNFLQWLLSDAGAGWVFGVISAIALVASYIYNKKKPSIIVFKELEKASLVNISSKIKDRVNITFDSKPIDTIGYVEAELYNEGIETIKEPVLFFSVPENAKILHIDVNTTIEDFNIKTEIDGDKAKLIIPYLNSVKEHFHILHLSILLDGSIDSLNMTGGGQGWSTRHYKTLESKKITKRIIAGSSILLIFSGLVSFYGEYFVNRILGINPWGFNLQVILVFSPIYLVLFLIGYWMFAPVIKSRSLLKNK